MNKRINALALAAIALSVLVLSAGCNGKEETTTRNGMPTPPPKQVNVQVPDFNADSAYAYIQKQVDFGPRVPNSEGHEQCADWLYQKLDGFSDQNFLQTAPETTWDGTKITMKNIIASFNPDASKRVLLCAHWDTRPWADEDIVDQDKPILGANDGGSGVGVLVEIARQLSQNPIDMGVDIVLFDAEDYGNSEIQDSYCLGSQYWAKKPHISGYKAKYGILLDMVGAEGAYFFQEGVSMHYAANVVKKVWETAHKAGYRQYFIFNQFDFSQLTDDHLYVNRYAKIPCIDIIQYDKNNPKGFGSFWHTHEDDMDIISTATLKAVGQTVLEVLYREAAGAL